jgi:hypothetical protein
VQTYTEVRQCTANFVFTDGLDTFIGQAAHCSGTGAANETDGCLAKSLPLGTKVEIDGATQPGTMVYNSWLTMQAVGEKDQNACDYNDFAPHQGGPGRREPVSPAIPSSAARRASTPRRALRRERLLLRQQLAAPGHLAAVAEGGRQPGHHRRWLDPPGLHGDPRRPGDSGSAFVDAQGRALGVLSTRPCARCRPATTSAT